MKKLHFLIVLGFVTLGACQSGIQPVSISFTELQTGTEASLRGLSVVNEQVVWASGSA